MKSRLRCALCGTGRIGSSLENDRKREKPASHAGAISHNRHTVLAAGADPDRENLSAFGARWRIPSERLFSSLDAMLKETRPDILHIASSTEAHIPNLLTALERKVPVIVLEKPVAENIDTAREALASIGASSSRVIVNHERRFSADYIYVRDRIISGDLGGLSSIHGKLFLGRTKRPRDVLWHDGTHMLDIIRFLAGSDVAPSAIHGNPWSAGNNVLLVGTIPQNEGDCILSLECSPFRDYLQFELDLSFEKGRIRVGNGVFEELTSRPSPYYEQYRSLLPAEKKLLSHSRTFGKTGYFAHMMAHAVELFYNPDQSCRSTFADGIASIDTIQKFIDLSHFKEEENGK